MVARAAWSAYFHDFDVFLPDEVAGPDQHAVVATLEGLLRHPSISDLHARRQSKASLGHGLAPLAGPPAGAQVERDAFARGLLRADAGARVHSWLRISRLAFAGSAIAQAR
jgi:hypothetical protein